MEHKGLFGDKELWRGEGVRNNASLPLAPLSTLVKMELRGFCEGNYQ
jgi:hypothetical protein